MITTGLVPLKPQTVTQQTQQQPQPLMQQLALPAISQTTTASISGVPLATAGQLYGSQIILQPTQVSNFFPATPSNLPPLPPPPNMLAAAAAAAAAAATGTLSTAEGVAQNQLLPNPLAPLQLQALPVYQPQTNAVMQQQAGNAAIVPQQQGGEAFIQQGYGILPGQLRPLDQLQQSGGMLIQQQCYVPTTAAITGLATLPPPPPVSNEEKGLPENWRTARDPAGKIYYYHSITK